MVADAARRDGAEREREQGRSGRSAAVAAPRSVIILERWAIMSTSEDLSRIALSLDGTTTAPHFDRTAFKVRRIYVTLAADGKTANFMFTPEQQEFKCLMAPDAFAPVANAWGKQGATTAILAQLTKAELEDALQLAWRRAAASKPQNGRARIASDRRDRPRSSDAKKRRAARL
jgi:hypothetical protein